MPDEVRVIQYGLGPIGRAVARHVVERQGVTLVGGIDVDPALVGRDVGTVIGLEGPLGFAVEPRLADVLAGTDADVALHTTSSYLAAAQPQILEIIAAGLDIVSTTEELSFPWLAHPREAAEIDAAAQGAGVTVLATGVNPGFLMDTLPLALSGICQQVRHIEVRRTINASTRRGPFQAKIGSGMTVQAFRAAMDAGHMGHVGLPESTAMVFRTLGVQLARYETEVEPVVAETPIRTAHVEVSVGHVRGLRQVARAYTEQGEFLRLVFVAALEAGEEEDAIRIAGTPALDVTLHGTNGDLATVAIVVNAVRRVRGAAPGLVTMRDLPVVTWW